MNLNALNSYRGIVIDPLAHTVTEARIPHDFDAMKRDVLHCDLGEVVDLGENVDAWVDEEGMQYEGERGVLRLAGSLVLHGIVVIIGREDESNDRDDLAARVTPETIKEMVEWGSRIVVTGEQA